MNPMQKNDLFEDLKDRLQAMILETGRLQTLHRRLTGRDFVISGPRKHHPAVDPASVSHYECLFYPGHKEE